MSRSPTAAIGTCKTCCVRTSSNPKNVIDWKGFFGEPFDEQPRAGRDGHRSIRRLRHVRHSRRPRQRRSTSSRPTCRRRLRWAAARQSVCGRSCLPDRRARSCSRRSGSRRSTDLGVLSQYIPAELGHHDRQPAALAVRPGGSDVHGRRPAPRRTRQPDLRRGHRPRDPAGTGLDLRRPLALRRRSARDARCARRGVCRRSAAPTAAGPPRVAISACAT